MAKEIQVKINFKNFYLFSVPVNFDIAWLKILFSNHLIVKLEHKGKIGIGEGVLYKTSSLKALDLVLKEFEEFFQQEEFTSFKKAREKLFEAFSFCPGVVYAFDLALWDLEGKIKKKPIYQLLGKQKTNKVPVAEQIFIPKNKIDLIRQVKKILDNKTKIVKLKAGRNLKNDLVNIQLIKEISRDKLGIQLDLNQALNFEQALNFGREVKKMGILAWEEPISFKNFSQLNKLRKKVKLPIILDESIKNIDDLKQAVREKALDILNIKISRLGGLTSSLQLIKLAQKNKIGIEVGCSEELGLAASAQVHLSANLRGLRAMEALGSQRLGFDLIKEKQEIKSGCLKASLKRPGLGVNFNIYKLRRVARKFGFSILDKSNSEAPFSFYLDYFQSRLKSKFINGLLFLKRYIWQKS